jgi:transcriptional regulator with XRE-family HTH domain
MEYIHQVFDGAILRQAREQLGYSQDQVGAYVGVTGHTVSRWENNIRNPRFSNLEPLREILRLKMPGWVKITTKKEDGELLRKKKLLTQKVDLVLV